jgi:hypothetical protein
MFDILKRFGFRANRRVAALILLVGAGLAAAFWIGPLKPVPAELQLLALGQDGRYGAAVELRGAVRDSLAAPGPRDDRYPLLLATRNVGARTTTPSVLSLSLPARFRLVDGTGTPYPPERSPNNPLLRYRLRLPSESFEPDSQVRPLARIDTLWLEPVLHDYDCLLGADRVPEFVPTPTYDPGRLSRVAVFYSFIGDSPGVRQAGSLELRVDSARLRRRPAPAPPNNRPVVTEPAAPMPVLGALGYLGTRRTECGDPMLPVELQTFAWQTADGGLFLVLYQGGAPRKYLFDLNADSIVELEMWDPDGDGDFEASRPTRLPLPEYLLPHVMTDVRPIALDSAWLANFHDVADGPFRFLPDSLRPDRRIAPPPATGQEAGAAPLTTPRAPAAPVRRDTLPPPVRRDTLPPVRRDTLPPTVRRDTLPPPVRRDTLPPVRRDTLVARQRKHLDDRES